MKEEERRKFNNALVDFKSLLENKGWKRLVEISEGQRDFRKNNIILNPLEHLDEALAQEFMKGEYAGIGLLMAVPEIEIDKFETLLKENTELDDTEKENAD